MNKIVVSVCMITYNHESFIREAIEGVLMQKTDFPIEIIIGEDCSTDNTRNIVLEYSEKYPDIIRPLLPENNLGMMKNFIETMEAATGKYIALCEGDDYWTDPYKLQKQVDFLEANEEYSVCFHNSLELNICGKNESTTYCNYDKNRTVEFVELLESNLIPTQSVVFRNTVNFAFEEFGKLKFGDWYLNLLNAEKGKIWYINEVMGVHRITDTSVWSPLKKTKQIEYIIDAYDFYKVRFNDHFVLINQIQNRYINQFVDLVFIENNLMVSLMTAIKYKRIKMFIVYFVKKIRQFAKISLKVLFKSRINTETDNYKYKNQIKIDSTTKLLNNNFIRFDLIPESRTYLSIGNQGLIRANFIFESLNGSVSIGNNVHIGGATIISRESILIGNDVTMAWDIMIYDHNSHSVYWEERMNDNEQCYKDYFQFNGNNVVNKNWSNVKSAPIIIQDKVWIGFGVTILKGVTIGEGAVIGAKSVVVRDVEPWTVVGGNPAILLKRLK